MVEQWDDTDSHVEELIALTGDYRVVRAAYESKGTARASQTSGKMMRVLGKGNNDAKTRAMVLIR